MDVSPFSMHWVHNWSPTRCHPAVVQLPLSSSRRHHKSPTRPSLTDIKAWRPHPMSSLMDVSPVANNLWTRFTIERLLDPRSPQLHGPWLLEGSVSPWSPHLERGYCKNWIIHRSTESIPHRSVDSLLMHALDLGLSGVHTSWLQQQGPCGVRNQCISFRLSSVPGLPLCRY